MNTAYDVEKTIGQLKEEGFISEGAARERMEEIIRGGGENENTFQDFNRSV